jgi:CDP-glucose 4,6-dehydratase
LNCDKAHAILNWHSALTIDECLQMTAEWYKKYYMENQKADVYALCVEQLRSYTGKATATFPGKSEKN